MTKIRNGLNHRNKVYWRDEIFIKYHGLSRPMAQVRADYVCLEQEVKLLKDRIIKLEKRTR